MIFYLCLIVSALPHLSKSLRDCGQSKVFSNFRRPKPLLFQENMKESEGEEDVGRIINGHLAKPGAWPWQVSVQLTNPKLGFIGHWCGGTLVDKDWVVTAAHCVQNKIVNVLGGGIWNVVLGDYDRGTETGSERSMVINDIVVHPNFTEYQNDIALLRLPESVEDLTPICIPDPQPFIGLVCMATGWGQTVENGTLENKLHQAALRIVSWRSCADMYRIKYGIKIKDGHICAGTPPLGGTGTCVGDSGGPLQCNLKDGLWYMVGLTSFGSGCAKPGFPDVFVRVSQFKSWMEEVIEQYRDIDQ